MSSERRHRPQAPKDTLRAVVLDKKMSGGLHAKRGVNYQDTVILDLLMKHFGEHVASGTVRPEGIDDLELSWNDSDGSIRKRFVQVKKPREDTATNPTNLPWTVADITNDLLPGALSHLKGNTWQQDWILGDELSSEALSLLAAGKCAPTQVPEPYWITVHRLARRNVLPRRILNARTRELLTKWRPSSKFLTSTNAALSHLAHEFGKKLETCFSTETAEHYRRAAHRIHNELPDVLSRIRFHQTYGSIEEVAERIQNTLEKRYDLDPKVVSNTLFRNLRGFVSDISTIPGRCFDGEEFEIELRTIWPAMMPVRKPPPLDEQYVRRPDLSSILTSNWSGRALEVIGISGAGKTMLAAEVYQQSRKEDNSRPIFYVEVGLGTQLRDVLIGVAFHLRRYGYTLPFRIASTVVSGTTAHDKAIEELVHSLASVPRTFLLLIDMIDGSCDEGFCRDLRIFANTNTETGCRLAVLGQESAFRHLTDLEREHLDVHSVDIRGFNFDEFLELTRQNHEILDYEELHDVFNTVTAGRSAGLYGRLARTLADAPTFARMRELSRSPPESLLQRAERQKFAQLSPSARLAAEKLICFSLPFSRIEVGTIFPHNNVGLALQELLELGLLRRADDETFEMHETVRAGLEGVVATGVRKEAHSALAVHYAQVEMVSTEVFHLEKAGLLQQAKERARAAFLDGQHWPQLSGYVIAHKLVTVSEVMEVFNSSGTIEGSYCFSDVISALSVSGDADKLLEAIRARLHRFGTDYRLQLVIEHSGFLLGR